MDSSFSTKNFTISLNDINEAGVGAIVDSDGTANYILENTSIGAVVGITAHALDPDTTDVVTYSLDDNAGGRFSIDSSTGVVTVAGAFDCETSVSYSITIRATSTDSSTTTSTLAIAIGDVNEFSTSSVTDSAITANSVFENAAIGTSVGITASATDSDATTNAITYSLFDNDGGNFAIDANTGVVTTATMLNREASGLSRNITIRATSADGSYSDQVFVIAINDVNEYSVTPPVDTNGSTNAVNENATIGTAIGITASASDADATTNTISYSLFDSDGGNFTIDANTGIVTTATMFNREASGPSRNITIRATSADGSYADQSFMIAINDVNEFAVSTVTDSVSSVNSVVENAAFGTSVGITASAIDADATTNAITYSMTDSDSGRFAVDPTTGIVTVAGPIDRETDGPSRIVTIRGTSVDGSYSEQSFLINIYDTDEFDVDTIGDLDGGANSVAENSVAGTVVHYHAFAADLDAINNTISYSLDDNAGGRFAIDALTGIVTVAHGAGLDYESSSSHTIVIRASSDDSSYSVMSVGISVSDVNEKPIAAADNFSTTFIDVLRILGAGVGGNDSDPEGAVLGFQLISGPAHGVLAFASDGTLEYTPESGFTGQVIFEYRAFDGASFSDPTTVTIDVLMPVVGTPGGSGSGGSGGSSGSGSGGAPGSGSTDPGTGTTTTPSSAVSDPSISPIGGLVDFSNQKNTSVNATDLEHSTVERKLNVNTAEIGSEAGVDGRGIGEMAQANSQRTLRIQFEHWASSHGISTQDSGMIREELALRNSHAIESDKRNNEDSASSDAMSFSMGTAVSTAIGTGAILWVVQATQLAATFISAASPTWMQIDIASALNNLAKEKDELDEASAKIFE